MTHKARISYEDNPRIPAKNPLTWLEGDRQGFIRHLSKLRAKAKSKGWYDQIPKDYYRRYLR